MRRGPAPDDFVVVANRTVLRLETGEWEFRLDTLDGTTRLITVVDVDLEEGLRRFQQEYREIAYRDENYAVFRTCAVEVRASDVPVREWPPPEGFENWIEMLPTGSFRPLPETRRTVEDAL